MTHRIILYIVLVLSHFSCVYEQAAPSTTPDRSFSNDDEDSDRICSERDSCQDSCDDMFTFSSEQFKCYDLTFGEVTTLTRVDDIIRDEFSINELEDIETDDLDFYLQIGFDSFLEKAEGSFRNERRSGNQYLWGKQDEISKNRSDGDGPRLLYNNSKNFLEWMGETPAAAAVILKYDTLLELGEAFFKNLSLGIAKEISGVQNKESLKNFVTGDSRTDLPNTANTIKIEISNDTQSSDEGQIVFTKSGDNYNVSRFGGSSQLRRTYLTVESDYFEFLAGFINLEFNRYAFTQFAADEENEKAFEWAHNVLVEYCKKTTDEDEDDIEVKSCIQTSYCIMRAFLNANRRVEGFPLSIGTLSSGTLNSRDGIFADLDAYFDIVGRSEARYCAPSILERDNSIENLYIRSSRRE